MYILMCKNLLDDTEVLEISSSVTEENIKEVLLEIDMHIDESDINFTGPWEGNIFYHGRYYKFEIFKVKKLFKKF